VCYGVQSRIAVFNIPGGLVGCPFFLACGLLREHEEEGTWPLLLWCHEENYVSKVRSWAVS
jgi:hypothetical protein